MIQTKLALARWVQPLPSEQVFWRYFLALICVVLATLLKFGQTIAVSVASATATPFITYYLAVTVTAWFCGFWPGIFTLLLSLLLVQYFFTEPFLSFDFSNPDSIVNLALFAAESVLICFLGRMLNQALSQVRYELSVSTDLSKKLELERNRFAVTLSSIGDAVLATDTQGRVTFMNEVASSVTGWTFAEAATKPIDEVFRIINETSRQKVKSPVERVLAEGRIVGLANHTLLIRKDGREVPIDDSGAPIRDEQQQVIGAVLAFRDISSRRSLEQQQEFLMQAGEILASSLDYEATLQNVANLAVPEIADWCSIYIPEADPTSGQIEIKQVAIAHRDPAKIAFAKEIRERYPLKMSDSSGVGLVLRSGQPEIVVNMTVEKIAAAGAPPDAVNILRELDLCSWLTIPMIARNQTVGALSLVRTSRQPDFTDKDVELAFELARRAALAIDNAKLYREANRSIELRNEFLSIAAHELKTPVTSLKGYSQLLLRQLTRTGQLDQARVERTLQVVNQQSDKLTQLINQLLDVSRLETRRLHLQLQPTDLQELLNGVIENSRIALPPNSPHQLNFQTAELAKPLIIQADPLRLEQVITNLINNAIKFSPAGGLVNISLAVEPPEARKYAVVRECFIISEDKKSSCGKGG